MADQLEAVAPLLDGVAETLLLPLYIRAVESQRPDALLQDQKAVELIEKLQGVLEYDWLARVKQVKVDDEDRVGIALRSREFDRRTADFLARNPGAIVVHIGCGLDTRFERIRSALEDQSALRAWYDLDLPQVIELRRTLIGGEEARYHHLACSVFDTTWMETLEVQRPVLFLAEGVMMYFEPGQVKRLVLALAGHFPGSELVFDAFSPYLVFMNNLRLSITKIGARYHWGLTHGRDLEGWGTGIRLMDEWRYFDSPEPRLDHIRWMRHIPFLANSSSIFQYRLETDVP